MEISIPRLGRISVTARFTRESRIVWDALEQPEFKALAPEESDKFWDSTTERDRQRIAAMPELQRLDPRELGLVLDDLDDLDDSWGIERLEED